MNPQTLTDWFNQTADNDDLRVLLRQPLDRDALIELAIQHGLATTLQDLVDLSRLSADELHEALVNSRLVGPDLDHA